MTKEQFYVELEEKLLDCCNSIGYLHDIPQVQKFLYFLVNGKIDIPF